MCKLHTLLLPALLAASAMPLSAEHFTVYFANSGTNKLAPSDVKVHAWDSNGNAVKEWNDDDYMSLSDYKVNLGGEYVDLFVYEFDLADADGGIIFRYPGITNQKTDDLKLVNGGVYYYGLTNKDSSPRTDLTIEPANREHKTYTIYFYDNTSSDHSQNTSPATVMGTTDLGTPAPVSTSGATDTGRYVVGADGMRHILYQCTFSSCLQFTEGYVYDVSAGDTIGKPQSDFTTGESYRYTLYFADTEGWGVENVKLHAWSSENSNIPYSEWPKSPTVTDTGKFVKLKDCYYPCYTTTVVSAYRLTHAQWRYESGTVIIQTCNFGNMADGDLFPYIKRTSETEERTPVHGPVVLVDEIPIEPATIYFHTGGNEVTKPGLWVQPCAHFYSKGEPEPTLEQLAELGKSGSENMTRKEEGMWKAETDNIHDYYDVGFYYLNSNNEVTEVFRGSKSAFFDAWTWAHWVYDIGTDCAHQSYMTPAQYDEMTATPSDRLYIIGNSPLGFDDTWNLLSCQEMQYDNGIYSRTIVAGDQDNPALFKLSFVNVKDYVELAGEQDSYMEQRGWATFNLNLVGAETRNEKCSWIYAGKPYGREHNAVFTALDNSMPYNKFQQWEWCISSRYTAEGYKPIEAGKTYYLIVDTHEADRSVSLVSFNPSPTVEIVNPKITAVDITYGQAEQLQKEWKAEGAHNGPAYFDRVNVATGTVKVHASVDNDYLTKNHYTVRYTVIADGVPFYSFDGMPDANGHEVPFLPVGRSVSLNVRARYTNTETEMSFCSLTGAGSYTETPELDDPVISDPEIRAFVGEAGDDCPDGHFAFGVDVTYPYSVTTDLAYLPDYKLGVNDTQPERPFAYAAEGWEAYDGTGVYNDDCNWAKAVRESKSLPLTNSNIGYVDYNTLESDFTLGLTAYAVYPFLVKDITGTTDRPAAAPRQRQADGTNAVVPDDLTGYTIVTARREAPHKKSLTDLALTGLTEATGEAADTDAPVEYYNLQGIRVEKLAEGNIYIVRQGNTVRKILK